MSRITRIALVSLHGRGVLFYRRGRLLAAHYNNPTQASPERLCRVINQLARPLAYPDGWSVNINP